MRLRKLTRYLYAALGYVLGKLGKTNYKKIVLICNYGQGYLCNPKYIAEALHRLYPGAFDIVVLTKAEVLDLPPYVRRVPYRGISALYELATARIWIDNCRGPKYIPKRDNQFYIQAWHGAIGPKKIEKDAENHLSKDYVKNAIIDGASTDLMFANNSLYERVFTESFWYDGPVIRCGMPRNRPIIKCDDSTRAKVYEWLGIDQDTCICLYAPTFRVNSTLGDYRIDIKECISALEERFGKRFVFAYRLHPNLADHKRPEYLSGCIDATGYPDVQELLAVSGVVISDYSSILEDFSLTCRPGFVYATDYSSYERDRGLYYSLRTRPFPVAETQADLFREIRLFDDKEASIMHKRFFEQFDIRDDGNGDEIIARIVAGLTKPGVTVVDALAG